MCEKCKFSLVFVFLLPILMAMAIAASVKMSKGPSLNIELLHDTSKEIRRLTNSSCVGIYERARLDFCMIIQIRERVN